MNLATAGLGLWSAGGMAGDSPFAAVCLVDYSSLLRPAPRLLFRYTKDFVRYTKDLWSLGDAALAVLTYLHKHGPRTLTELSEYDRVSPASMSQTVNRLTSAGYAVRARDPGDRRKVLFSTTAEGAEDRAVIARATALLDSIADS